LAALTDELRPTRFFNYWTLKEAYVKAIGKGLSHSLNSIVFDPTDRESIRFLPPSDVEGNRWRFALRAPTGAHCLAVAVRHDPHVVPRIHVRSAEC
jgi:4'-phosphopantetheinyl transferase